MKDRMQGSPLAMHWFGWIRPEDEAWLRVIVLFEGLMAEDEMGLADEVVESFEPIGLSWSASSPEITQNTWKFDRTFIKAYFKVDNPTLLPVLLNPWYHLMVGLEASTEAATFRIADLARNPSP